MIKVEWLAAGQWSNMAAQNLYIRPANGNYRPAELSKKGANYDQINADNMAERSGFRIYCKKCKKFFFLEP
jgi:hypothetical protein